MNTLSAEELYQKLKHIKLGGSICTYTKEYCKKIAPIINKINQLKKEKNAIILAHSYVAPDIITGVADFVGDSYELSKAAKSTNADIIIFAAVKFMAETAKLLNPNKMVIIPSSNNGCSLADSITTKDILAKRKEYPNFTFVCYINTTAKVKAECDVCVTSSNAASIIENISNENIYFIPDKLMAQNLDNYFKKNNIKKNIKYWEGSCYVHEEYDPDLIRYHRLSYPKTQVLAHPECHPDIVKEADFTGSTSEMIHQVKNSKSPYYFLMTECGLTSRLQMELPHKNLIGTCTMCQFMKSNTLTHILQALVNPKQESIIQIDPLTQKKALLCLNNMFFYSEKKHEEKKIELQL